MSDAEGRPTVELPEAVLALLAATDADTLLRDAESLATGLADAGWTPDVESGRFAAGDWDLLSSAWAPNLSVFFEGEEDEVRVRAQAVASFLTSRTDRWAFHTEGDDWSGWPLDDVRWTEGDWMAAHPLEWRGGGVIISLYLQPDYRPGKILAPANLHIGVDRADTPPEGLFRDDERARRVVRDGSVVDRWFLAGEHDLPDDVIAALENDPDSRVRVAAESERWYRERTIIGPPPTVDEDRPGPGHEQPPARFAPR
ncbi:hypothetical protein NS206_14860 [Microbacterium testaceum]|uniref:hypothetical protein n=1 Tax=Microbacterium testaceum TaxID=2033 RepID=UPI000733DBEE|nr:hypothetical protein [Microbacterium testaceum]KTS55774.1 hypothetical protein NS206_14860 [Microbacterium testaceum]